jgi:hypothetical protein
MDYTSYFTWLGICSILSLIRPGEILNYQEIIFIQILSSFSRCIPVKLSVISVLGSWLLVLGSWFLALGSWVLGFGWFLNLRLFFGEKFSRFWNSLLSMWNGPRA